MTDLEIIKLENHSFVKPCKQVLKADDIAKKWDKSQALHDLLAFIGMLNESVKNNKLTDQCFISERTKKILSILERLSDWLNEIPPLNQPQRFGNKAYRIWFQKLDENKEQITKEILLLEEKKKEAGKHLETRETESEIENGKYIESIEELSTYLIQSVGNQTRIDYGTGHELAFVAFLCCLYKIGAFNQEDHVAIVTKIFHNYIELMRKVQTTYKLEPAGSQGVWNLDDFQFIPFIWGSAQLHDHRHLKPKAILDADVCEQFSKHFMFFGCINYINQVKTGPFAEHSNQLYNITGVATWAKVNQGLIKMYRVEVLSKFPVIQHFLFGSLLKIDNYN